MTEAKTKATLRQLAKEAGSRTTGVPVEKIGKGKTPVAGGKSKKGTSKNAK